VGGFDLIIFDCDGVLVDSERLTNTVFAGMLTHNLKEDSSALQRLREVSRIPTSSFTQPREWVSSLIDAL
jgi:beta-phosphoglucomutase-like phosphatase (HAD superfamily)